MGLLSNSQWRSAPASSEKERMSLRLVYRRCPARSTCVRTASPPSDLTAGTGSHRSPTSIAMWLFVIAVNDRFPAAGYRSPIRPLPAPRCAHQPPARGPSRCTALAASLLGASTKQNALPELSLNQYLWYFTPCF